METINIIGNELNYLPWQDKLSDNIMTVWRYNDNPITYVGLAFTTADELYRYIIENDNAGESEHEIGRR